MSKDVTDVMTHCVKPIYISTTTGTYKSMYTCEWYQFNSGPRNVERGGGRARNNISSPSSAIFLWLFSLARGGIAPLTDHESAIATSHNWPKPVSLGKCSRNSLMALQEFCDSHFDILSNQFWYVYFDLEISVMFVELTLKVYKPSRNKMIAQSKRWLIHPNNTIPTMVG